MLRRRSRVETRDAPLQKVHASTKANSSNFKSDGKKVHGCAEWLQSADDSLRDAVLRHGDNSWGAVSRTVGGFTEEECEARWDDIKNRHKKGAWTDSEDELVRKLVDTHGAKKWSMLATYVPGRTGKQCRERWLNHLAPGVKKTAWTAEEEQTLIESHAALGNQWSKIALNLPGRTENACKNHWNSFAVRSKYDIPAGGTSSRPVTEPPQPSKPVRLKRPRVEVPPKTSTKIQKVAKDDGTQCAKLEVSPSSSVATSSLSRSSSCNSVDFPPEPSPSSSAPWSADTSSPLDVVPPSRHSPAVAGLLFSSPPLQPLSAPADKTNPATAPAPAPTLAVSVPAEPEKPPPISISASPPPNLISRPPLGPRRRGAGDGYVPFDCPSPFAVTVAPASRTAPTSNFYPVPSATRRSSSPADLDFNVSSLFQDMVRTDGQRDMSGEKGPARVPLTAVAQNTQAGSGVGVGVGREDTVNRTKAAGCHQPVGPAPTPFAMPLDLPLSFDARTPPPPRSRNGRSRASRTPNLFLPISDRGSSPVEIGNPFPSPTMHFSFPSPFSPVGRRDHRAAVGLGAEGVGVGVRSALFSPSVGSGSDSRRSSPFSPLHGSRVPLANDLNAWLMEGWDLKESEPASHEVHVAAPVSAGVMDPSLGLC